MLGPIAVPLPRQVADLNQPSVVATTIEQVRPDAVINCAGWTAVDDAEAASTECHAVNAIAVGEIAKACNNIHATLVQVSTDYVFGADLNRSTPFSETDLPGPLNVYGASNLAGEEAAIQAKKHLIIRTSGLYAANDLGPVRGRNFADTMLCLAAEKQHVRVVSDQHCTPSFVPHVADGILDLLRHQATGLFHVVNNGSTTWHGFACELFQAAGIDITTQGIPTDEYPTAAPRPRFSVLSTNKFEITAGRPLPNWRTGIAEYVKAMKPYLAQRERTA